MSKQVSFEVCHACSTRMKFELDLSLNGNHVLNCPKCGHEHCRVVANGKVTSERWHQRNGVQVYYVATYYAATSTTSSTGMTWMSDSWNNTTAGA